MARYKGHNGAIEVGAVPVGEIESFDIEINVVEMDANVMGQQWTDVEAGQKSATGSITVLRDRANTGQAALVVGTEVTLTLFTEGDVVGLTQFVGSFLLTSVGVSVSVGDIVKSTYSIRNSGTITESAIPV